MGIIDSGMDLEMMGLDQFDDIIMQIRSSKEEEKLRHFARSRFISEVVGDKSTELADKLLVLIVCSTFEAKETGSTVGMKESVQTSRLLKSKAIDATQQMSQL